MKHLQQYLPQEQEWFESNITYEGKGELTFSSPKGWLKGDTKVVIDEFGDMTVRIVVKEWYNECEPDDPTSDLSRMWLSVGYRPTFIPTGMMRSIGVFNQINDNIPVKLRVVTDDGGVFYSQNISSYKWNTGWDFYDEEVELQVNLAEFIAPNRVKTEAFFWIIPLLNFVTQFGHLADRYIEYRQHPLRIFPVPDAYDSFMKSVASDEDKRLVSSSLKALSYLIMFLYRDKPAFIEQMPSYQRYKNPSQKSELTQSLTALMVGETVSDEEDIKPIDLLPVLGLATGRPVSASWIEFRDENIELVYRVHALFGHNKFEQGRLIIDDMRHKGGIGHLLTVASKSSTIAESNIRGALRNLAFSVSSDDSTLKFYYIFTGLERMFEHYKVWNNAHPLKSYLTDDQKTQIEEIIKTAKKSLRELRKEIPKPFNTDKSGQSQAIDSISKKFESVFDGKDKSFGVMLKMLLDVLDFHDIDVVEKHLGDATSWINLVNYDYRNPTMHVSYYRDVLSRETMLATEQLLPHLTDILVRVLLKTIGYNGTYFSIFSLSEKEVDWVQPDTKPHELGFRKEKPDDC